MLKKLALTSLLLAFSGNANATSAGETFFENLKPNTWTLVPTNTPRFEGHAGWAVDSKGGRIFLFGSDTHGDPAPDNSIHIFDARTLQWQQAYKPDPLSEYKLDTDNWSVTKQGNPWASHVFDNIVYLPHSDSVLVVSAPLHNGAATTAIGGSKGKALQTWKYSIAENRWEFLKEANTPQGNVSRNLWSFGMTYNSALRQVIALHGHGSFAFEPIREQWRQISGVDTKISSESMLVFNPVSRNAMAFTRNQQPAYQRIREYYFSARKWGSIPTRGAPIDQLAGVHVAVDSRRQQLVFVGKNDKAGSGETTKNSTLLLDLTKYTWSDASPAFTPTVTKRGFLMGYLESYDITLLQTRGKTPSHGQLWAYRGR